MAKKAAKRGKTRSKKARKKAAKKSAKKAAKVIRRKKTAKVRRKAAKKTARKAAKKKTVRRPKAAKRKAAKKTARRPKPAKKAAKPKRPAKAAPKAPRPVASAPVPAPVAPKPMVPASVPKSAEPGRSIDVRESRPRPVAPSPQPKPTPSPQPSPQVEANYVAGRYDTSVERYYSMLARNTPESHRLGTHQVDKILAANPKDVVALAEKAHDIVNNWRNDCLSEETVKECQMEFLTGDPFACAIKWAERSIDAAKAQGLSSPYGYWARAYAYKYQKRQPESQADYKTALSFPPRAFINHVGRRRKDLLVEWLEGLVYWARKDQIQKLIDKIDTDAPAGPGKQEGWINWVKCFALHLVGKYEASNALYPDHVPEDKDVHLIIAANQARQGHEQLRQLHRKLFLEKDGNANWSAAKEIERSPFIDKSMRDFWFESVEMALRAPAAAPSAAPTQSI